jgi:sugar phosphate isomerase/epimerase
VQLSICPQPLYALARNQGRRAAFAAIRALGLTALELPVDRRSPLVELESAVAGEWRALKRDLDDHGLSLSAVSVHQDGQLLLGPHHRDTDGIHPGSPAEKVRYAQARIALAGQLAEALGVTTLVGFMGCEDYSRWFPWPDPEGWERMQPVFVERCVPLLDQLWRRGVRFAQEPHPKQMVYNLETAQEALQLLAGHPAYGFNLDPANLLLAGVDPVLFAQELAPRILHVHAKDGEVVAHNQRRSGLLAHGPWDRPERGFRFRIPGWGQVPWKGLISTLALGKYQGYLAIENEDPVFEPRDGLEKAIAELSPLLPKAQRQEGQWW